MSSFNNRFNNASPLTLAFLLATGHIGFQLKRLNWLRPELPPHHSIQTQDHICLYS